MATGCVLSQWKVTGARQRSAKSQATEPVGQAAPEAPLSAKAHGNRAGHQHGGSKTSTPVPASDVSKWKQGWAELSSIEKGNRMTQLQEMGFSQSAARSALEVCDWDVNRALDSLFKHNVPATAEGNILVRSKQHSDTTEPKRLSHCSLASESTSASSHASSPSLSSLMTPQQGTLLATAAPNAPVMPPLPFLLPDSSEMVRCTDAKAPSPFAGLLNGTGDDGARQELKLQELVATSTGASPMSVVPKRKLAKVEHTWTCDVQSADTQLSIEQDTFVYVWSDSTTASGWVYAESLMCSSSAGWMPASMLQKLPPNKCWMRVSKLCLPIFPTQMAVDAGNMILVDASTPPVGDGWVYAEAIGSASGRPITDFPCSSGCQFSASHGP